MSDTEDQSSISNQKTNGSEASANTSSGSKGGQERPESSKPAGENKVAESVRDEKAEDHAKSPDKPSQGEQLANPKKEKVPDPVLSVLDHREELGNDPLRGILKWEYLDGLEAAGKKVKFDILLKLFLKEMGHAVPDRFLIGKIVDRMLSSPKDFRAKSFWAELSATSDITAAFFAKFDSAIPAPVYSEFQQTLLKSWKKDQKELKPEQVETVETWRNQGQSVAKQTMAVYRGAQKLFEENEILANGIKTELESARDTILTTAACAENLRRTINDTAESKLALFPARLNRLIEVIDEKQSELNNAQSAIEILKIQTECNAETLRKEIAEVRKDAENERAMRLEADKKREECERNLAQANWDKNAAKQSNAGLKNDIAASLSVFFEDFSGMSDEIDPATAVGILKSHLSNIFGILQRKGIPLGNGGAL